MSNTDDKGFGLLRKTQSNYFQATVDAGTPLFTTDAEGLWDLFMSNLSKAEQQEHTCHSCRHFVNRFGHLVSIDADGNATPVMWPKSVRGIPAIYRKAMAAVRRVVAKAQVNGIFLSIDNNWGTPVTGVWTHMAVPNPVQTRRRRRTVLTVGQQMAAKREANSILRRSLAEFNVEVCQEALNLLRSEQLYRPERAIPAAEWVVALHDTRAGLTGAAINNVTWLAVAGAPEGFCNIRSNVLGTLLSDIAEGKSFEAISASWRSKLDAGQYQRAQVAPSAGNIKAAEKLFDELGLAPSLSRRYASMADIPSGVAVWEPRVRKAAARPRAAGGLFGHVQAKGAPVNGTNPVEIPATTMTWSKFARTVLPGAQSMEAQVPVNSARFAALVTAENAEAPPILQWDREDDRNPVSWYYHGGIDAEMKRRVEAAGGRYDDNDIRATLIWNNRNDLDIHCITPSGQHIHYAHKQGQCGGWLDIDMNVQGETDTPVENIRWARGRAPSGHYRFYVRNYSFHGRREPSRFAVELAVGNEVLRFDGMCGTAGQTGAGSDITVFEFDYRDGRAINLRGGNSPSRNLGTNGQPQANGGSPRAAEEHSWGLAPGSWAKVNRVVPSPNLWGAQMPHHGNHMFFLLDGCQDSSEGLGRGFFTETLRSELRPVRSTLESHMAGALIEEAPGTPACGIGMSAERPWGLLLRVKTSAGTAAYKIDRWD